MIGSTGYVIMVTLLSLAGYVLFPNVYACDFFLIGAVYISLFSSKNRTLVIVWFLGMFRGAFSGSYIFYPFFFVSIFCAVSSVRTWLRVPHPLTQFLVILVISAVYGFSEVFFTMERFLSMRFVWYWGEIAVRGILNAAVGTLLFRLLHAVPVRPVVESEKGTF